MCGIVGAASQRNVTQILLGGIKRLEYRGYDSAGIAVINDKEELQRIRIKGKVSELIDAVKKNPLDAMLGIAHTRWATHGIPSEHNAHPHISNNDIAVVHNGIIENFEMLKQKLVKQGYAFASDTDTEIIAHLIHYQVQKAKDLIKALKAAADELEGAFALGIIFSKHPKQLFAIRQGSPLVIGKGINENFIASDTLALLPITQEFIYLEEGDIAEITNKEIKIYNNEAKLVERETHTSTNNYSMVDKGKYRHFMQKEIFEQGETINATLQGRLSKTHVLEAAFGADAKKIFDKVERVTIVACGTSYHAGLIARYWLEEFAGIPCHVEIASEYRYRHAIVEANSLFVTISQSGETADTLAALRLAKERNYLASLVICNVPESSLVRESDLVFMTCAGAEIGVASTKAFTTQLTALLMLTAVLGRRHHLTEKQESELVKELKQLPKMIETVLNYDKEIESLAKQFSDKQHSLFLGRGSQYPVALEGALKLKEISYIHAEAYPAGELKHGPLALVDKEMPVIAVAPNDKLLEKLKSNLQEVQARGGKLIVFADAKAEMTNGEGVQIISMPEVPRLIAPIIYTIPLQLLAYHVAVIKGTDVDQPRNLAKSVTVE